MRKISILLIALALISGILGCNDYPDIPEDAVLAVDQPIGNIDVKYWERVIDGVFNVINDYILLHLAPDTDEIIKCEQQWRDVDVDLADLEIEPFEPPGAEYFWKRVVVLLEEGDVGYFYNFYDAQEYPLVCWEVRCSDGMTIMYDLNGNEIGYGIPAPSDGLSLSGYCNSTSPDGWMSFRENAAVWFQKWSVTATNLSLPTPATVSSYVSDPDYEFYYAIAHGGSSRFQADSAGSYYRASDAEADIKDRDPMLFAFIGHCEGMTDIGPGSFSHAFRKGSMTNTVTVGYSGMSDSPGWPNALHWQTYMLHRMDKGHTMKDAFDLACAQYPLIAGDVVFVGDPDLTLPQVYVSLTTDSTAGGFVAEPGEGVFIYDIGTVVDLVASPVSGYEFVNWTGDVDTVANIQAAATTITMNDSYAVIANFEQISSVLEIRNWYDLDAIRDNLDGSYVLINELVSTTPGYQELASQTANGGKGWQPIGTYNTTFTGTFNGQGYEISDLFIDRPDEYYVGLFGFVAEGATIRNIGVANVVMTGYDFVGGLVGYNAGTVNDSYSTGNVDGRSTIGGLIGQSQYPGTVSNSHSDGSVNGTNYVGGLVGRNAGFLTKCYSSDIVIGDGDVGGLVGIHRGTISSSYSIGTVIGSQYVGGLVGIITDYYGTVNDSYSTGNVYGGSYTGGLVGLSDGTVSNSYSTGYTNGIYSIGGLVGASHDGTVTNSFWDTETSGQSTSAGGTGKNTTEMQDITTFSGATWNITTVSGIGERNITYIWNIVNNVTYPFLSWQS